MIQDMKTILTRMFTVVVLMMISMAARADVKVLYGEKGTEKFEGTGGTIEVKQEDSKDDKTKVTVTLIVTPSDGYTLAKDNSLEVYAVISPDGASTRALEISGNALKLDCNDFKDISQKRTYTVDIDSKLALWIKKAEFHLNGSKEPTRGFTPGLYYIASNGNAYEAGTNTDLPYTYVLSSSTNFYLRPAADPQIANETDAFFDGTTENKPFLTSNITDYTDIALWALKKTNISYETSSGTEYYYTIQHVETGKYVVCDPYFSGSLGDNNNSRRKTMHLETKSWDATIPDKALFKIRYTADESTGTDNSDSYCFIPKRVENKSFKYLNLADRNQPVNYGTNRSNTSNYYGGLAGLYKLENNIVDKNSLFKFEPYVVAQPTITFNNATNEVTITATVGSIYYTTNGDTPTSSLTGYSSSVTFTQTTPCTIRAIAVKSWSSGIEVSSEETPYDLQKVATPTFTLNTSNNVLTITSTEEASISYSTGAGSTPETAYGSPFEVPYAQSNQLYRAIAEKDGWITSDIGEQTITLSCHMPAINFNNNTQQVTLTCADTEATMYYTTNGDTPNPGQSGTTQYAGTPISLTSGGTLKAIAVHTPNYNTSDVAEFSITQVATPTIQNNGSNAISITCATEGATIYYTTDGSTPTTGSTLYTEPLTENVSGVTIKAIAVKENMITSEVGSGIVKLQCATPVITRDGMTFSISCSMPTDATFYYSLDGSTPTTPYSGAVTFTTGQLPMTVKAVAKHASYNDSEYATFELINGSGTSSDPYLIYGNTDFTNFISNVNAGTTSSSCYKLMTDISASGASAITTAFTGTFDGGLHTISGLGHALFNTVNGGVVKNVILDNVGISGGTNVGAICNEATGNTRIYNCGVLATNSTVTTNEDGYTSITSCSSTILGSGFVGGIVGLLDGSSRVINCFSYANITGGDLVGGIVGKNAVATTSSNLKTMVMNCMFYGNITGGTSKAPIYNGEIISNVGATGVGNYNYFLADATFTGGIDTHNCALMAEKRFLQRFEFFRQLQNSHLELAGWWATGTFSKTEMAKWVLEPSQLGTSTPYPILKARGKYPSVVNYDAENTPNTTERNKGRKLGTLTVSIQMGSGGAVYGPPTGAKINTSSLTLNILDKDPDHFNFNYYKVQLPYYNDVGTKNYNGNRVVAGWKIVSINGGTAGSYTAGDDASASVNEETGEVTLTTPYNFADRHCTNKDLYLSSGRVFNQGAYWDVPEGVTAITIEPYWAKCVYLADANADVVYNTNMNSANPVANVGGGTIYTNGNSYSIAGESQVVHTTMGEAISSSNSTGLFVGVTTTDHTVYDYAVVFVGNYHHYYPSNNSIEASNSKPYTVTSIDLDGDNEPDCSYIMRFDGRAKLHPVRVDFLNVPGLGMAQKSTGSEGSYNFGIMLPKDWFEVTNTALFRVTQFEYEQTDRAAKPLILHGGVIEQWVSAQSQGNGKRTTYIHVGSNVWFKEFHLGCHQDKSDIATKHPPVSVTGGDYGEFYLTGLYATTTNYNDNAECYINGGRYDKVAGAGTEGIGSSGSNGNIVWQIQNADIEEFYGGGINAAKPIEGNITTVITGSHVKRFCGGPKFGDMNPDKTVITSATNCTFGSFFGAGYGGNSYYRAAPGNFAKDTDPWDTFNVDWNAWIAGTIKGKSVNNGNYANGDTYGGYDQTYNSHFGGVSTRFDYQFLPYSDNKTNVARLFIDFVTFSLATTRNVTSTLKGCTITGNFYGGGSLGKVDGNVTSTLTNCSVRGSVFGGGYDATRPTVQVMNTSNTGSIDGFLTPPSYDKNTGVFIPAAEPYNTSETYTWEYSATVNSTATAINPDDHILYTTEDLTTLGQVTGNVTLNILGNTLVEGLAVDYEGNSTGGGRGGVFGGGDASAVLGNTTVTINTTALQDGAAYNAYCVYGGGNVAPVGGNSTVTLKGNTKVFSNVFGGGNEGKVEGSATVNIGE